MKKILMAFMMAALVTALQVINPSLVDLEDAAVNSDRPLQMEAVKVAQAQGTNIWFYSSSGIDHWLTKVKNEGGGVYTASVTTTRNGQFHQLHVYRVTSENGVAYTSTYDRMSGQWESWHHSDYAQALWKAIQENF